jgi:O-antigen ligase
VLFRFDLDKTYQYLLITLGFLLPLTVFGANLIIFFIVVLWFLSGNYKSKIIQISESKVLISSIVFFLIHLVGLIWTEDLAWGFHIVHKMWYFCVLFPVLYCITKKEYIKYYIFAFLMAILLTEILSYLIWFEIIRPFKNAALINPTPFMSHISFNPILAFAIYLVGHKLIHGSKLRRINYYLYGFFFISMSFTMFITLGRAGQVMYFFVIAMLVFQFFQSQKIKASIMIMLLIPSLFFTAYSSSNNFANRVDNAYDSITNYSDFKGTAVGQRISFTLNSLEIIRQNLLIGVGTGDFVKEYEKVHLKNTPNIPSTTNPHNMYILVTTQNGLLGLLSLLSIFYYQLRFSIKTSNLDIKDLGIVLPIFFLILMISDSYLLGHYTTLLFIFFSSFIHKNFEKN